MSDFAEMMKDPQLMAMIQALAKKKGMANLEQFAKRGASNNLASLADAYPKLKAQSDQMKIQEAERKVKRMKFESLLKQAEQQYKLREQQRQMQQGMQQVQAARQSV